MTSSPPPDRSPRPGDAVRPRPRPRRTFTREQVRRRQIVAGGCLALVILLVVISCSAILGRHGGGGGGALGGGADDSAMSVPATPADAAALSQLPKDASLGGEEALGIDVSAHQGEIDWTKVRGDGISFAYIKATEGTGFTDPQLNANWSGARGAGVTPGAYHYFTLCSSGADQAKAFLAAVPPSDDALPPALDLEFDGACEKRPEAKQAKEEVAAFIDAVEKAWGRRVVLYSSREWRDHYGLDATEDRPDWLYNDGSRPVQGDWALWQTRFDGSVAGVKGDVDIDVLRTEVLRASSSMNDDA
ncbi:lysozyme [Brachybacterium sp. MASK1Z-5]|uniref:Lysozyme n=1 Tax=Brachybacterium halotolerans TaxID=2795215 RepID=A0ABS1BAS1_9MICO|nr:lysozyme [Brachybacterium halotolerans]